MALPKQNGLILSLTHIRRTLSRMPKEATVVTPKNSSSVDQRQEFSGTWEGFLPDNENKILLIKLIQSEWCTPKYANLLFYRHQQKCLINETFDIFGGELKGFLTLDIKGFLCDICDTCNEYFDIFYIK